MPVLLDYAPPEMSEDTATAVDGSRYFRAPAPPKVVGRAPAAPDLVVLSDDPVRDAMSSARAVLSSDASADLVAAATRLVAAGYTVRKLEPAEPDARSRFEPESALTQREMQVLGLLADGASNKVIARKLDISVHTAKFHVAQVSTKLRARNRTDAISIALREGVLMA